MKFQDYLPFQKKWPAGYRPSDQQKKNTIRGALYIQHPGPYKFEGQFLKEFNLRVKLVPVYCELETYVQARDETRLFKEKKIYEDLKIVRSIEFRIVESLKTNFFDFQLDDILLTFDFLTQQENIFVRYTHEERGLRVDPPGLINAKSLWLCGGFYRPGCRLEEIEPMVFAVHTMGDHTNIRLDKLSSFLGAGACLDGSVSAQGWTFMHDITPHAYNLKTWIKSKKGIFHTLLGMNEAGEHVQQAYILSQIEQPDLSQNIYDIYFERSEMSCR